MQVINNFRAHVLHHSSAAEKMGKHELARNIVSVKQAKNEGKCSKFLDKISAQRNLISHINEKSTLDKNAKKERIAHIQIKLQCNEGKLNKLLDKKDKYQSKIALEKLSSNNKYDLISINEDHYSYKNVANEKLGEQLIKHYGLEAEQYLDDLGHGFTESETMAIGLYTNGEYKVLNQELREGQNLSEGNALIDKGLSSSFEKTGSNECVIKTYRGTQGGDAFNGVAEGHSGRDAGYLSTSHNLGAAESFGRGGTVSIIFGRSGLDVSEISIEVDEKEVLYNKNTDMTVLFSERGRDGITRRVLEESSLSVEAGTKKGLVDALDIIPVLQMKRNT